MSSLRGLDQHLVDHLLKGLRNAVLLWHVDLAGVRVEDLKSNLLKMTLLRNVLRVLDELVGRHLF